MQQPLYPGQGQQVFQPRPQLYQQPQVYQQQQPGYPQQYPQQPGYPQQQAQIIQQNGQNHIVTPPGQPPPTVIYVKK